MIEKIALAGLGGVITYVVFVFGSCGCDKCFLEKEKVVISRKNRESQNCRF